MSKPFSKHRNRAFTKQQRRCYYCTALMWLREPTEFAVSYGVGSGDVARFKCTAEHLVARQDGGTNQKQNIVAACWFCNATRHRRPTPPPHDAYRILVRKRVKRLKWHPTKFRHLLQDDVGVPA
jgi:hypothetical protein